MQRQAPRSLPRGPRVMNTPIPVAHVLHVEPNPTYPGAALLTVLCPFCGRTHTHGEPDAANPEYGHRVAHCTRGTGYNIVGPTE